LKMMLEAATRLSTDQQDQAMDLVKEVRDQLSESMESLRSTVRRMKPASAASNQYTLEGLLDQIARDSGILVRYRTTGQPYPLYPSEEVLLYRNAQEAITNAVRHGQATEVTITLDYCTDEIRMTISNNGSEPSEGSVRKGL